MSDTERERINAICEVAGVAEIDDLSDGFHTFRQLYYQRMMLFATIVRQNKDKAWKSLRHEDGELCFGGGWFIVGIDTPEGSYTYHYEDNYYSLFDCEELERGKHWDGHTEKDVTRLLSLPKTQLFKEGTTSDLISKFIDGLEEIFAHIREKHVDDSVCGLCEYDGAYIGQSGNWYNECPGFNMDDCFKLSDKTRREWTEEIINALPTIQPEPQEGHWIRTDCGLDVECKCSKCGYRDFVAPIDEYWFKRNYCPNCGARMKGERQK